MLNSIRSKLSVVLLTISLLIVILAMVTNNEIDRMGQAANSIIADRIPVFKCSQEAMLAATLGADLVHSALSIDNPEEIEEIRIIEGEFREKIISFDMFSKAVIWGSESQAFKASSGGLTLAEWKKRGLDNSLIVKQASHEIRHLASVADIYFSAFAKYTKFILKGQRRILRLMLMGRHDEILKEKEKLVKNHKKVDKYRVLTIESLEKVNIYIQQYFTESIHDINQKVTLAKATLLFSSGAILILSLISGFIFSNTAILKPIESLMGSIRIIGKGNLNHKVALKGRDEISQLAQSFNQMTENLKKTTTSIDDLNKEVDERRKAEENLKKAYKKLKITQDQLIQAEKLNAIGRLASGVAHEVRNPLAIITHGIVYVLSRISPKEKDIIKAMASIKESAARADGIVNSLLDFSKATAVKLNPEFIDEVLGESLALIKTRTKAKNIDILKEIRDDVPKVLIDKNRIEQVFINVFLNAMQAMEEGGRIIIRCRAVRMRGPIEGVGRRAEDNFKIDEEAVMVEIEDTGYGIPKENMDKIEEPFFTTKGPKEGTGLGLSVCKNIIMMHKGLMNIQSEPGRGTKVTLYLKAA